MALTNYTVPVGVISPLAVTTTSREATRPVLMPTLFVRDIYHGGLGRIGPFTIKVDAEPTDLPLRRRVRLFRDRDGLFIREAWSDAATGLYQFDWIDQRERYTAIAYDYEHAFESLVASNLAPTLIP
ncbi:hypothetical protein [Variovorax sp. EBFNA2]|uniref:hypothetical protein n=1 Tax=Variovorax sp. EBFNA2 TaxID=3342097 RepID=UPI0029C0CA40|nr:hypothetical protein [Variovorax boronicumulans]WPG35293.1 hypothetical protein RZE79_17555 [Variovorax boronicumulans]